ncbi:type IV pili methyl-accepting chemotaxis transducer N-terminal domain-containing protein [Xenophilus arseniciresistens]|uniref:Type IV pili methyl-accepting chemotaxis transducer N-terminal domain-containing protein n=1 Tax=Xenophilus arseniciresistens TaxID=1283306 RepID=A0AAE3SZA0_9BURK|nr:type IV pili methyl-accepting chemotaxis transducer N-terminal domain-containing protein [Xenophilus arseniciresistens]MDA7415057.1 type IV pili methyl-accepting chemotaxis transducer N-terminal domain-containing protein [Xenophilus arseniciresistens]
MTRLLLVLPDADAVPEALHGLLAPADAQAVGTATCDSLVQQAATLVPQQVLAWQPASIAGLRDALNAAWAGAPPFAVSLVCGTLAASQHEELVDAGVNAWAAAEGLDAPALRALLARAAARWRREAALREAQARVHAQLDERKWVDRAKGLLMSARGIDEDAAFVLLRGAAMHANLRVGALSRSVVEAAQWAEAINRAGQLRMLSQRLVRLAAQALAGVDAPRSRTLRTASAARVKDNLAHLAALSLDEPGRDALQRVRAAWEALGTALEARMSPATLAAIDGHAEALLANAEALTDALEAMAGRRALRIVNLCGRQRMRAQRLAKDALLASLLGGGEWRSRLAPTMDAFEASLLELERAPLSSPDIRAALGGARDEWLRLVRGVREADRAEGRADLVRASEVLADTFDRLTASYEHSLQVIMA